MVIENSFLFFDWRDAGKMGTLQRFEWYTMPSGSSDSLVDLYQLNMPMFAHAKRYWLHWLQEISNQITAVLRQVVACTLPVS